MKTDFENLLEKLSDAELEIGLEIGSVPSVTKLVASFRGAIITLGKLSESADEVQAALAKFSTDFAGLEEEFGLLRVERDALEAENTALMREVKELRGED